MDKFNKFLLTKCQITLGNEKKKLRGASGRWASRAPVPLRREQTQARAAPKTLA